MLAPSAKVLVAISGGPDSVFLAWALHKLGYDIALAHVNYGLRGEESEAEARLVTRYAVQWGIPLHLLEIDPLVFQSADKNSLQMKARTLRYDFFERLMAAQGYSHCATAHQADDQAESILMSLIRGNDARVIYGVPSVRGAYVRPLLGLRKSEIMAFLEEKELPFSIDSSNLKTDYLRNKIRHQVLPVLQELNPAISSQLNDRLAWYEQQQALLEKVLDEAAMEAVFSENDSLKLHWRDFEERYGGEMVNLLIVHVLKKGGFHGKDLWEIVKLKNSQVGREYLTATHRIVRTREGLMRLPLAEPQAFLPQTITLESLKHGMEIDWGANKIVFKLEEGISPDFGRKALHYLDVSSLSFPLTLRSWQKGDQMRPLGMAHFKKLSDIFVDEKYDPQQKAQAWVLEDQEEIVFLSGFRVAEKAKWREDSKCVLKIRIINHSTL